jgi:Big-like domain-containing protein
LSRLFRAALAALSLAAALGLPAAAHAADPTKVAIIVGPVGALTPTYLALAEIAAGSAEQHGATVARAYSPNATPANVLAAVADANIIIYFGHGYGHPSPYGWLDTSRQNGWALQGPAARGTHDDGLDGYIEYFGEDWIVANARPAPGFVMIYSNTCYAPGASEGGSAPATPSDAALRVAHYSRAVFAMGGSAYYATDFDAGAADLVGRLLADRSATYGAAFAWDYRFVPSALTSQVHQFSPGQVIWLHHSTYAPGPPNYWYAFAGNPDLAPLQAWDRAAPTATLLTPLANATDVVPGTALELRMSEPVTGVSAVSITLRDPAGELVAAEVAYDEASSLATLRPAAPLALSSTYAFSVTDAVRDVAGRRMVPVTWRFTTRIDADPLTAALSIVLEPGGHELVRTAEDGTMTETRTVEVHDRRGMFADARARLPGRDGSWLRIADPALDGWWVAESARAHSQGQTEEALLAPGTEVALRRSEHPAIAAGVLGAQPGDFVGAGDEVDVAVDRRRVSDGRTYLRLADTRFAGAWVEVAPSETPTESASLRVIESVARSEEATLAIDPGERPAFLFDSAGRVIDRRTLAVEPDVTFSTLETRLVGGLRFVVIGRGELIGWAVAEGDAVRVIDRPAVPTARE